MGLGNPTRRRVQTTYKPEEVPSLNQLAMGGITPKLIKWYNLSSFSNVEHSHVHTTIGFNNSTQLFVKRRASSYMIHLSMNF